MKKNRPTVSRLVLSMCLALAGHAGAQPAADRLILVTIDGLRWQEVFYGLDSLLLEEERYTPASARDRLRETFPALSPEANARQLFPFLHDKIAVEGSLLGDRRRQSCVRVNNPWHFSYPGYNEILTGRPDPGINSNDAIDNSNITFLEWLHEDPAFSSKIAAFTSWNVFPAILNTQRSGIPVNAGRLDAPGTPEEHWLNRLHQDIPSPWDTVRLDAFTHHFALSHLRHRSTKVLYVAYGETDDFAHDGRYDLYIDAAHRTDRFLQELWDTASALDDENRRTVMLITVDHGRGEGPGDAWRHHASAEAVQGMMQGLTEVYPQGIEGSEATWIAALGPGIADKGLVATGESCVGADQIAATALQLLGRRPQEYDPEIAPPITEILE